ncbi:MAG: hypothetical protein ACK5NC_04200 [Vibrio sp.]
MAKALCKVSRKDIRAGKVAKLLIESQFFCGSCARSSNQKSALCKPVALSKNARSNKQLVQARPLSHPTDLPVAKMKPASNVVDVVAKAKALKAQRELARSVQIQPKENGVNLVVPSLVLENSSVLEMETSLSLENSKLEQGELATAQAEAVPFQSNSIKIPQASSSVDLTLVTPTPKKAKMKKELKRLKKQQKEMKKLLKKQRKIAKKHQKLLKLSSKLHKRDAKLHSKEAKLGKKEAKIEKRLSSIKSNTMTFGLMPLTVMNENKLKALH